MRRWIENHIHEIETTYLKKSYETNIILWLCLVLFMRLSPLTYPNDWFYYLVWTFMPRTPKYYSLSKSVQIPEIADRLEFVFKTGEAWPIDLAPDLKNDNPEMLDYTPAPHQPLPNREMFESEIGLPLDCVRLRLGEKEPMRLLGEPWFVLGHTIFFESSDPDNDTILAALMKWRLERPD
jgi:hypothetical protein